MSDDFTSSDPRCIATLEKLAKARARMERLGIKTLLAGHRGWQTVNPMADKPDPTKILTLKRRPR